MPISRKTRLASSGRSSIWRITISFTSIRWSMSLPIPSVTDADDLGQLLLDARVDRLADPRGQVVPEARVLALDRPLDEVADVVAGGLDDVLGDRVGLEALVELLRAAELRDPLVDRDAAHLRRPRGHDPLPADPALGEAERDLAHLAREEAGDRRQPRDLDPLELHRVEEHQHPRPVRHVADRPREQRHREQADRCRVSIGPGGPPRPAAGAYRVARFSQTAKEWPAGSGRGSRRAWIGSGWPINMRCDRYGGEAAALLSRPRRIFDAAS